MKTIALLFLIVLTFSYCKKQKLEPIYHTELVDNNSIMRVLISNTGSTNSSQLFGKIIALDGTDTLYIKELSVNYPTTYLFDTTISVNSSHIEVKLYTVSMKNIGGINYDYDNYADGNVKIFLGGDLKVNASGSNIVVESKIK